MYSGMFMVKSIKATKARRKCLAKFLYYFKKGYKDPLYIEWERQYKLNAHLAFKDVLGENSFKNLFEDKKYKDIAAAAVRIESKTNLLFSFEKMALRDAVKSVAGSKIFAAGLYDYLYGNATQKIRFENFVECVRALPRKQTRVLTWPLVTVFGFIGNPKEHIFLKPRVTKIAAEKYNFEFSYASAPNWDTYSNLLDFADQVKKDTLHLSPHDYIDLQSFIWVMGSEEYPD
jgi:hypothetical protein